MKKSRIIVFLITLIFTFPSSAQEVSWFGQGKVVNAEDKSEVVGATVLMINIKDSTRSRYAITDGDGRFRINNLEKAFYRLQIASLGYKQISKVLRVTLPETNLGTFNLEEDITVLSELEIKGEVVPMEQIGDTTQYNAAAFKTNPDASASDLVSKMPGVVVDGDGVTANGESVEQVLLDGKRFFGQDPLLALNTIPAEIVDKIQVYDELSEQSQLTGFDDGNTTKTMNVVTKADKKNGQFGKAYAGYGTEELYKAGVNVNSFNQDTRTTIIGMSNNINQQNFSSEDLAEVSGGRGGFRSGGGGNRNFLTGNQDGITQTNSVGINFTDDWGKKATFEGSYFFNQTDNNTSQLTSRESFLEDGSQFYDEDQQSNTENLNHRLNMRVNYDINDKNEIRFISGISYQNNESSEFTFGETFNDNAELLSITNNSYLSQNKAYNISNNLIYQYKLEKIGRTLSLNVNSNIRPTDRVNNYEDLETDSIIAYSTDEDRYTLGSKLTYTEPIGSTAQLAVSYEVEHSNRKSDKQTFTTSEGSDILTFSQSLSNEFESAYTKHLPTVLFSNRKYGQFINVGLSYQHAELDNSEISPTDGTFTRRFNNVLPSLTSRIEFSQDMDMFVRYSTSTSEPSISQLQNVLDNSDPLFLSIGNPDLGQSYSHSLVVRARKTNVDKNSSFSNFTRVQNSRNYISTATTILSEDSVTTDGIVLQRGAQLSTPINLNGYWSAQNNSTYGILISPLKSNFNTSVGISYARQPGLTNGVSNVSNTYSLNTRFALVSNISEKIDYNVYYQINGSRVTNAIQEDANNRYYTQTVGAKLNLMFGKGFVFRNDIYYQSYNGVNSSFDTQYTLWNMSVAKKFLKNDSGELELSVFDLLGENQSFDQNVNATYLEETRTEVLQRYFMLTFTYQLRRFK